MTKENEDEKENAPQRLGFIIREMRETIESQGKRIEELEKDMAFMQRDFNNRKK